MTYRFGAESAPVREYAKAQLLDELKVLERGPVQYGLGKIEELTELFESLEDGLDDDAYETLKPMVELLSSSNSLSKDVRAEPVKVFCHTLLEILGVDVSKALQPAAPLSPSLTDWQLGCVVDSITQNHRHEFDLALEPINDDEDNMDEDDGDDEGEDCLGS